MKLIVGLGNPGKEYQNTRHNIGFQILDTLNNLPNYNHLSFNEDKKFHGIMAKDQNIILFKPSTFMNNSGEAVRAVTDYFKINSKDILIIHDDLDIDFGNIKIQQGKSAAGHNGVSSIISHLGNNDFWRLRYGVAGESRGQIPGDKYVLSRFSAEEEIDLPEKTMIATNAVKNFIEQGAEITAQKYNQIAKKEV
ncbi:MAG: aminoacyl-tRNA hydrolase [Candidatus Kerfeldbacteria bacterium]